MGYDKNAVIVYEGKSISLQKITARMVLMREFKTLVQLKKLELKLEKCLLISQPHNTTRSISNARITLENYMEEHIIQKLISEFESELITKLPSSLIAECILPRKHADAIILELEDLYKTRFVPRYGQRRAKILFHTEVIKAAFSTRWEGIRKFLLDWKHKPTRK